MKPTLPSPLRLGMTLLGMTLPGTAALSAALLASAPLPAQAQTQVKPYFLVVFDTSGSMNDDAPANSCGYVTGTQNPRPRKMDAAKCALGNILNATGDADFGLMQFAQSSDCGFGSSCGPTSASAQMRVPIQTNTAGGIAALIDKDGIAPADELCAGGYTPLGGTLVAAKEYFEGQLASFSAPTVGDTALACRPLSVILLTDGVECCDACSSGSSLYNTGCPNANAELTAAGLNACPAGANACGTWGGCGNNNNQPNNWDAFESAPEKAWLLREQTMVPSATGPVDKTVRTYVIGFGITPGDARIERIAVGGGTDNPVDGSGGLRAFYAQDEAALAIAFSQIIADSQPPTEICNGIDDDCDTLIDEGFPKYCNLAANPPITERVLCDEPDEENCDGIDDDCDGIIDEGLMNECGICGEEVPDEICDGFDNDCDGIIDEGTGGGACGREEGECEPGLLVCVDGTLECEGAIGPRPEECNGLDDDCDGKVDEDPLGTLCPDGRCVAGVCSPFCSISEFAPSCDRDRDAERQPNGECLCVISNCDRDACAETTLERDGAPLCAPDDSSVATCTCRGGECTHLCDGIACPDDEICDPRRGRCVINSCRGLGCDEGQLCDVTIDECVEDACADTECRDGQVCRRGRCERSCGDVRCGAGERCAGGECVADPCASVSCTEDRYCDPSTRTCEDNPCRTRSCDRGFVCVPTSGECEPDRCFGVRCPSGQGCRLGECYRLDGSGESPLQPGNPTQILATGAGGCACSAVGAGAASSAAPNSRGGLGLALAGALGLLMLGRWRARRRARPRQATASRGAMRMTSAAGTLLAAWLGLGCEVSPFCLDCVSPTAGTGTGGSAGVLGGTSAGTNGGTSGTTGGVSGEAGASGAAGSDPDAGPDACSPLPEECNGRDDDCDGRVDEGIVFDVNNCEQRGICQGSMPACVAGRAQCQFPPERELPDETTCDGLDNDCDGRIDEAFPTLGNACSLGVGQCATPGTLQCNGAGTGVVCVIGTPREPSDEICDGIDNDCDGLADEPESNPGMNPSYVRDALVQVSSSLWMYTFEAARPDATDDAQGIIGERACSKEGVLPWTNVTYDEAVDACEAADMRLCTEAEWVGACSAGGTCPWGYTPSAGSCVDYPSDGMNACNGHDLTALPGAPDNDALAATGAFARCFAQQSGGRVFDLSGNAKEWVTDSPNFPDTGDTLPAGSNPTRGGSYNNLPGGMRCDFSFSAANNGVRLRNLGFRCCTSTAPAP